MEHHNRRTDISLFLIYLLSQSSVPIFCPNLLIQPSGISHFVGSVTEGLMADLVLWCPMFFGIKPKMILKAGQIVWSEMGEYLIFQNNKYLVHLYFLIK